jgi:hypothetical protein
MSERRTPRFSDIARDTHDQVHAVLTHADEAGIMGGAESTDVHRTRNGVITRSSIDAYPDARLEYVDRGVSQDRLSPSSSRHTEAELPVTGSGKYTARLKSNPSRAFETTASIAYVEREGYGIHEFSKKNTLGAAALITSLAAKRISSKAITHTKK